MTEWIAIHTFDVDDGIPFDQEVVDCIYLPNPNHGARVKVGMIFLIRDGPCTVGHGRVGEICPPPA